MAACMFLRPGKRWRRVHEFALMACAFHHLHQLRADFRVAVHDRICIYCVGAVNGGGKRFNSLFWLCTA